MIDDLIALDGAEDGGHSLRAALSLSLATGRGFALTLPEPLGANEAALVRAAAIVGHGFVEGAEPGSARVLLRPGARHAGDFVVDAGKGSATAAAQVLALPLALWSATAGSQGAGGQRLGRRPVGDGSHTTSTLTIRGGTHLDGWPSFHDLTFVWAPLLERTGFTLRLSLPRAGFAPDAAGEVVCVAEPAEQLHALFLPTRGTLLEVRVLALTAGAERQPADHAARRTVQKLRERGMLAEAEGLPLPSGSAPGYGLTIVAVFEHTRAAFSAVGAPGKSPDQLAGEVVGAFADFMEERGAVSPAMAEELVLPLALAAAGVAERPQIVPHPHASRYTTSRITPGLVRAARAAERFLDVAVIVEGATGGPGAVIVARR